MTTTAASTSARPQGTGAGNRAGSTESTESTESTGSTAEHRTARSLPHLPGLDGLRALAVAAVVLYHLGAPWMPGGFLGVDVFFVLSGYLIATLVLDEVEVTGRLRLGAFYRRRARRLLPALGVLLLAAGTVGLVLRDELAALRGDVAAALLYGSNWWQVIVERSYFEATGRPPLLQHLWSLAVEEQFYLVLPCVALLVARWGRARLGQVAIALAVASTAWMTVLAVRHGYPLDADPTRAYVGTDTHAMGLLVGVAAATVWTPWRTWTSTRSWLRRGAGRVRRFEAAATDAVGGLALVGAVVAFVLVDEFSEPLYRGGFLAFALLAAVLVGAAADPGGLLGRALSLPPLRWVGQRSYGIYLWHWPVAMLTRPEQDLLWPVWAVTALRVVLTLVVAELSYRYVELPVRRGALARVWRSLRTPAPGRRRRVLRAAAVLAAAVLGVGTLTAAVATRPATPPPDLVAPDRPDDGPDDGPLPATPSPAPTRAVANPGPSTAASAPPSSSSASSSTASSSSASSSPVTAPPAPTAPSGTAPAESSAATPARTVAAYGDSVMLGARPELRAAGIRTNAAESRQFAAMVDLVEKARAKGRLADVVVVHGGTNGPIRERDLRRLVRATRGSILVLVNDHVPRAWERRNNQLLAAVASGHADVHVVDWDALASRRPRWLYDDGTHLRPGAAREGYARLLQRAVRSLP